MPVPEIKIESSGSLSTLPPDAQRLFAEIPGSYRAVRAESVIFLTLDEGSGAAPRDGEVVALAGDLRAMSLLGLLNLLGQNRETGRLVIKHDKTERVIMLRDGDVASVGSNAPEDRVGRFLVRTGNVTEEQLNQAVAEATAAGGRVGQVLVSSGLLQAHDLWKCIQAQITEIFTDVVTWELGSFVLYRMMGEDEYRFPSTPPLSMQGLLLEAVRRADEMQVYRKRIPGIEVAIKKTGKELPEKCEDLERRAFALVEDTIPISELARLLHLSEFDATRTCYQLVKHGVAEIVEQKVEPAAEPYKLTPQDSAKLEVYNLAFREIRDEVVRSGQLEGFMVGVMKYLSDPNGPHHSLLKGIAPDPGGALPVQRLASNLAAIDAPDPWAFLQEALNKLTFFMLFQCGELLDAQSDENLGRRVRLIHAALAGGGPL